MTGYSEDAALCPENFYKYGKMDMEQQKLEKMMAFAFIFIGAAMLMLLLNYAGIVPFFLTNIFMILAAVIAVVAGVVLYRDSSS